MHSLKHRLRRRILSCLLIGAMLIPALEPAAVLAEASSAIPISSRAELEKIGTEAGYPMNGDYQLTADIDLSGEDWEPFGGHLGNKGTCSPTDSNVFSGTFDGQGHVISGLTINLNDSINQEGKYGQVGLFSVIGSNSDTDYAEVKNLIFTNVDIRTDFPDGLSAIGTLAGEVNGYAKISNIAVISGDLDVNPSRNSDTVGAGGIIGECRTQDSMGNNHITVTDCYNGADINAGGSREDLIYASGIIGRIAKSPCQSVSQCLNTGDILYNGYMANAIVYAETSQTEYLTGVSNCYFLKDSGQASCNGTISLSAKKLTAGNLPNSTFTKWTAEKGCYPLPTSCYDSHAAGEVYLSLLSFDFADGENIDTVKSEFPLPQEFKGTSITWSSDNETALSIENGKAVPHTGNIGVDTLVTLTAQIGSFSRSFMATILTSRAEIASFDKPYAKVGEKLSASVSNTGNMQLSYEWNVGGQVVSTTDNYTPTEADLEKFITVTITSDDETLPPWTLRTYFSELPVVYVDTEGKTPVTSNENTIKAHIKLQGNKEYNNTQYWYDGETDIKGRGNSTWSESKKGGKMPYKLKLDKKANLLGLGTKGKGTNKHWCLLANMIDHTNIRNELVHTFARDIGMEYPVNSTGVVLIFNGEYQGLYELSEHIRVGGSRVDVFDWEDTADEIAAAIGADICAADDALDEKDVVSDLEDIMEKDYTWVTTGKVSYNDAEYTIADSSYEGKVPEFTGGFLLDMDFRIDDPQYAYKFISTFRTQRSNMPMFFRRPEYAKTSPVMMAYAKNYLDAYESALASPDFTTTYNGETVHYTDLFDLDSLVRYWLICEYTNNWDSMKNSSYLYKDLEGKAKMGPDWDYDWAFGNINMYSMTGPFVWDNWHTTLTGMDTNQGGFAEQTYQKNQWYHALVKDPYFVAKAYEYWQKYYPTVIQGITKENGLIDELKGKYQKAAEANDDLWETFTFDPERPNRRYKSYSDYSGFAFNANGEPFRTSSQTYDNAMISLRKFIEKRVGWMNGEFADVQTLYRSLNNQVSGDLTVSAAKENGQLTANATVTGSDISYVTFLVNGKKVTSDDGTEIPVTNGKASVPIHKDLLEVSEDALNTVEILGVNSGKNYIAGKMNFTTFTRKDLQAEGPTPEKLAGSVSIKSDSADETAAQTSYPGNTLQASIKKGNNSGVLSSQWYADNTAIEGANLNHYRLTDAEIGKEITVKISSSVESGELTGTYEGTVSAYKLTGTVMIQSDSTTANTSYPNDVLTAAIANSNNSGTLSFQWFADDTAISGATGKTYTLTANDVGKTISVKVISNKEHGELSALYTGTVTARPQTGETELTGTVTVQSNSTVTNTSHPDDVLTATLNNTNNSGTLSYRWYANGSAIAGATGKTYTLTENDIGKTISVKITSSVETGELSAEYEGTVKERPQGGGDETALTGTVTIQSNSTTVGTSHPDDVLTAELTGGNNTGTLSYQWFANNTAITGATGKTYKLTAEDIGKTISVKITSSVETGDITAEYKGTVKAKQQDASRATGISLSAKSKTLQVYGTFTLKATITPSNVSQNVLWRSSKPAVATVLNGKITAKAAGKTTITATTTDGSNLTASCTITVAKPSLKVSGKTTVKLRKSITLTAKANGLKGKITWKLDKNGKKLLKLNRSTGSKVKLTAKKKTGKATLTISCGKKKVKKTIKIKK